MLRMIYDSIKYNNHNKWSRDRIAEFSLQQFHKTVKKAYRHSRFYQELYTSHGIQYNDLGTIDPSDLPIIDKEMVQQNFDSITTIDSRKKIERDKSSENLLLLPGIGYLVHTSGSTGKPCDFVYSKGSVDALESNFVRLSIGGGNNPITLKDFPIKCLHVSSVGSGYASMMLALNGLRSYHAKSIIVKASDPLDQWIDIIGDFSPNYLSGYPSCIDIVANMQKKGQIHIQPKKIITGGEPMVKETMNRLGQLFHADVVNYYGCTESLLIGAGTSWYDGLYLFDDMNFVEIDAVDRLIITPLTNSAFPLIRYRMTDVMEGFTKSFTPPLPFTHIDRIIGRYEELLWFENSKGHMDFLHPLFLDDLDVKGVEKYQFEQIDNGFIIRCVSLLKEKEELEKQIRKQIDHMLNAKNLINVKYRVTFVGEIPIDPVSGKTKMVVKKKG